MADLVAVLFLLIAFGALGLLIVGLNRLRS